MVDGRGYGTMGKYGKSHDEITKNDTLFNQKSLY